MICNFVALVITRFYITFMRDIRNNNENVGNFVGNRKNR